MGADCCCIVSDLHLGSVYFQDRAFLAWLDALPEGAQLVLNGDVVDKLDRPLPAAHQVVLDRLVCESQSRSVVWVYGNHDAEFILEEPGAIQFVERWALGRRLLVIHGDRLDQLMPRHGVFKWVFRRFHRLLIRLGFRNVHVAEYAKQWKLFYRVLNKHVARNALRAARQEGFAVVVCGHTHAAMDLECQGQRYFNTGSWTEKPLHFLEVTPECIVLRVYEDALD